MTVCIGERGGVHASPHCSLS